MLTTDTEQFHDLLGATIHARNEGLSLSVEGTFLLGNLDSEVVEALFGECLRVLDVLAAAAFDASKESARVELNSCRNTD